MQSAPSSKIDTNHTNHKLTFGFIHEIEKQFNSDLFIVPDGIIHLCLLYFFQFIDQFAADYHGKDIKLIKDEDDKLTKLECPRSYSSAYGTFILDFAELPNSIIQWTIRSHKPKGGEVSVGIIAVDPRSHHKQLWDRYPFRAGPFMCYGLWIGYSSQRFDLESCGKIRSIAFGEVKITRKDLQEAKVCIKMTVDTKDEKLTYVLNDKDYGWSFENIDTSSKYQLVVGMCRETALEISDFRVMSKQ